MVCRFRRSWAVAGPVAVVALALGCWFFGSLVAAARIAANGDGPLYYDPMFRFVQRQWAAGRVPLWNPNDDIGMPLAALGTTSVFYPGKLLFFLPIAFERAYGAYLLLHELLAAYAAYRLARRWRCGQYAAGLAAVAYAFSGQVVYQYCYLVYLVSAAWLPLALEAADRMLRGRSWRASLAMGGALAMMILGGDPQMAYHAGLIATIEALWLWRRQRSQASASPTMPATGWLRSRPALLALAATAGLALAAIQVLPTAELARRGDRAITDTARSLYEIPKMLGRPNAAARIRDGFLARFDPDTLNSHMYNFSVPPWRLGELVWPDFGGRQYPLDRRWMDTFDYEFWLWTPSLYLGLLPILLALTRLRLWGGQPLDRGLTWLALAAVLASFGRYGLGWLAQHLVGGHGPLNTAVNTVGGPWGGLYWAMAYFLPGYCQFRIPAKLMTLACLAIALLAARGWDELASGHWRRLAWVTAGVAALSTMGLIAAPLIHDRWLAWFTPPHENPLFGPVDAQGALADARWALARTLLLCGLMAAAWLWTHRRRAAAPAAPASPTNYQRPTTNSAPSRWLAPAAIIFTALDLALANGWLVYTVPAEMLRQPPKLAAVIRELAEDQDPRLLRIHRKSNWVPWRWKKSASPQRWDEIVAWDHDTLMVDHHLSAGVGSVEVWGTITPSDFRAWFGLGGPLALQAFAQILLREPLLGERPGGEGIAGPLPMPFVDDEPLVTDVSLWRNDKALPRAWIAHHVQRMEPIDESDIDALLARTKEVLIEGDRLRDFQGRPVVEGGPAVPPSAALDGPAVSTKTGDTAKEHWEMVRYEPNLVEITAQLATPGLFILADQYFPGWNLEVESDGQPPRAVPIVRTNRALRGAWLPAGQHRLVYRYQPASVAWGAGISLAAILAIAAVGLLKAVLATRPALTRLRSRAGPFPAC